MFTVFHIFYHDSLTNLLHQSFSHTPYQVPQGHPSSFSAHLISKSNSQFWDIPLFEPPAAFETVDPSFPSQHLPGYFLCQWSSLCILKWFLLEEVAWPDTPTFHLYHFSASIWLLQSILNTAAREILQNITLNHAIPLLHSVAATTGSFLYCFNYLYTPRSCIFSLPISLMHTYAFGSTWFPCVSSCKIKQRSRKHRTVLSVICLGSTYRNMP